MSEPPLPGTRWGLRPLFAALALLSVTALAGLAGGDVAGAASNDQTVLRASFERSASGWRGHRARVDRVRGGRLSTFAARVTPRRVAGRPAVARTNRARPTTVAGGVYSARAWARARRSGRICLQLREFTARGRKVGAARSCRAVGRRWTAIRLRGYRAKGGRHRLALAVFRTPDARLARRRVSARSFFVDQMALSCRTAAGVACATAVVNPTAGEAPKVPPPESWWYSADSYWKKPARSAPLDPRSDEYISWWKSHSSNPRINLVAAGCPAGRVCDYAWSRWEATADDPLITVSGCNGCPLTFHAPAGSRPAPGDGEITIIDHSASRMYEFGGCSSWSPGGTGRCGYSSSSALGSNGLDRKHVESDSSLNWGHRGLSCMTFGFAFDEVQAREVAHMIKITVPSEVADDTYVFPYVGTENGTGILPEGLRVRLKDSALPKIEALANPYARAMAAALYTYGSTISDKGGKGINIKVQNPGDWGSLGIGPGSLSMFTVDDFEVVRAGWKG